MSNEGDEEESVETIQDIRFVVFDKMVDHLLSDFNIYSLVLLISNNWENGFQMHKIRCTTY